MSAIKFYYDGKTFIYACHPLFRPSEYYPDEFQQSFEWKLYFTKSQSMFVEVDFCKISTSHDKHLPETKRSTC